MHHRAILSLTKSVLLTSLLFLSNTAYAQDLPETKKWKHGLGIHNQEFLRVQVGEYLYSKGSMQIIEYAPRRDWTKWSLHLGIGTGVTDRSFHVTNVSGDSVRRWYDLAIDYYASIAVLIRVNSNFSVGPSYARVGYSITGYEINRSRKVAALGVTLSSHSQNRKHAFEGNIAGQASTLGYRWHW